MDATEFSFSVIDKVLAMPQREINDIYTVHLAYLFVTFSTVDILRYQFGSSEQHALEIGIFIVVLHFDENQFAMGVHRKHVHPVVFVEFLFLITFAFQEVADGDILT